MAWRKEYLSLFFPLMGLLFAAIGWGLLAPALERRKKWLSVEGTVTSLGERPGSDGQTLWFPVYRYWVAGVEYTGESDSASSPPAYRPGDAINLRVNPADPGEAAVHEGTAWRFALGFLGAGLFTLALGSLVAWLALTGRMR